jgi:hypothetical protein
MTGLEPTTFCGTAERREECASAKIAIATGETIAGSLPGRAHRLVREWIDLHRAELEANWERAVRHEQPRPIDPLR